MHGLNLVPYWSIGAIHCSSKLQGGCRTCAAHPLAGLGSQGSWVYLSSPAARGGAVCVLSRILRDMVCDECPAWLTKPCGCSWWEGAHHKAGLLKPLPA
jgi:hypothetical protein